VVHGGGGGVWRDAQIGKVERRVKRVLQQKYPSFLKAEMTTIPLYQMLLKKTCVYYVGHYCFEFSLPPQLKYITWVSR
jgi:hypothetical protein